MIMFYRGSFDRSSLFQFSKRHFSPDLSAFAFICTLTFREAFLLEA